MNQKSRITMNKKPIEPRPITQIRIVNKVSQPTEAQIKQVIEMYPNHTNAEIVEKTKVTAYFLRKIATQYNLQKSEEFTYAVSQMACEKKNDTLKEKNLREEIRQQIIKEEREKIRAELYEEMANNATKFQEDVERHNQNKQDEETKTWNRRHIDGLIVKAFKLMDKRGELLPKTIKLGESTIHIVSVSPNKEPSNREDIIKLAQSFAV